MKRLLFLTFLLSVVIAQSFDINGNLKVTGAIEFSDSSQITSADKIIPSGMIMPFAGTVIPFGWLLCDGTEISRTDYADLFNAIGETYGYGDGTNTFVLPDFRGRFLLGLDNMGGSSANTTNNENADILGGYGGEENHTLTIDEMPEHTHSVGQGVTSGCHSNYPCGGFQGGNGPTGSAGGDEPHNNMPPFISINYLIKL